MCIGQPENYFNSSLLHIHARKARCKETRVSGNAEQTVGGAKGGGGCPNSPVLSIWLKEKGHLSLHKSRD